VVGKTYIPDLRTMTYTMVMAPREPFACTRAEESRDMRAFHLTSPGNSLVLALSTLSILASACGDDGGGGPEPIDAAARDGGTDGNAAIDAGVDAGPPTPSVRWLVYEADRDFEGVIEAYAMRFVDGVPETPQRISKSAPVNGQTLAGRWSPDGRWFALAAEQDEQGTTELYVIDFGNGQPALPQKLNPELVGGGDVSTFFEWSPDSTRLAYLADQDTNEVQELYVVDFGPGAPQPARKVNTTLPEGGSVKIGFTWSSTSRWLVYTAETASSAPEELFAVDLTGGPQAPLTLNPALPPAGLVYPGPLWAPDGEKLAYVAEQDAAGVRELYVVDFTSTPGAPVKVNGALTAGGNVELDVSWSPDSSKLLYRADEEVATRTELYLASFDRGALTGAEKVSGELPSGGKVQAFRWAPDGARFAYVADPAERFRNELFAVRVNGAGPQAPVNVSNTTGSADVNPVWSPDSRKIAYFVSSDGARVAEAFVADLAGAQPVIQNVHGALPAGWEVARFDPVWLPDSTRLLYHLVDEDDLDSLELYLGDARGAATAAPIRLSDAFDGTSFIKADVTNALALTDTASGAIFGVTIRASDLRPRELFFVPLTDAAAAQRVRISEALVTDGNVHRVHPAPALLGAR
jgi:Tol biopolymer transport system component